MSPAGEQRATFEDLVAEYRHLRAEHRLSGVEGTARRHLARDLAALESRIERRLALLVADGMRCRETFTASPGSLAALRRHVSAGAGEPPWEHAPELLRDGLVDPDSGLTPRGRRALARSAPVPSAPGGGPPPSPRQG